MAALAPIFTSLAGLNAALPATRIGRNPAALELAECVNFWFDDSGRATTRRGFKLLEAVTGGAHSLFAAPLGVAGVGGDVLYVTGAGELLAMDEAGTSRTLRAGLTPGARMSFKADAGIVFWCNGFQSGLIVDGVCQDWREDEYAGPLLQFVDVVRDLETPLTAYGDDTPTDQLSRVVLSPMPVGHLVEVWRGRAWVALDQFLVYSEPFYYAWHAPAFNYLAFGSRLRMVRAVDDGLYVADDDAVYFLAGADPEEGLAPRVVAKTRVLTGTDVLTTADETGLKDAHGACIFVTTSRGILLLLNGGVVFNWTKDKLPRIAGDSGTAAVHEGQYIALIY
jgi:hypothetical protein